MTNSNAVSSSAYEYLDNVGPEERARLEAVRRYRLVDQPLEDAYDRIAFVAAAIFDTPIATVSLVEQDRVWLAACEGLGGVREVGKEPGLCASVIAQDGVYVINNAAVDPRTLEHPLVRGELGLRFYAAAPIRTHDGYRLGAQLPWGRLTAAARPRAPRPDGVRRARAAPDGDPQRG